MYYLPCSCITYLKGYYIAVLKGDIKNGFWCHFLNLAARVTTRKELVEIILNTNFHLPEIFLKNPLIIFHIMTPHTRKEKIRSHVIGV
uniref:Uncharacterized protein n=1 Tax=Pararge aegeria TaxID=116150 RepID=S4PAI1_9NEOP